MAVSHKGPVSFSLVHVPVSLYTATKENLTSFNQLHAKCHSRIKQVKRCPHCECEVSNDEIVKGFEYEKGKFVIVTDDDLEKIKTPRDRTIKIDNFVDVEEVGVVHFEKAYHAVPDQGSDKAYEMLRLLLEKSGKVAIAQTVIGQKEQLLTLMPTKEGILAVTLYYADEVKSPPKGYVHHEVSQEELDMGMTLLNSMCKPFDITAYHEGYHQKKMDMIAKKIEGKEIVTQQATANGGTTISLVDALKQSLAEQATAKEETEEPERKLATV